MTLQELRATNTTQNSPSDSAALVMESMGVPIVDVEKGKSVLLLVGIFRPLICLETKQTHKI